MMWKNICQYIFSSLLRSSKIETSILSKIYFLYTNLKDRKFLWLDQTFVSYYFASFMALKLKWEVSMP